MSWKLLRPQIAELLTTVDKIQEVSKAPKVRFNGYPSAHIVPSDNTSDYETTHENERVYAWNIRLFYETKDTGIEEAFDALEEVVDEVIDLFDQEDLKGSNERIVAVNLPSRYTFINLFAIPNRWGELPEEQLIMAEITVRIRLSIDVT